MNFLKKCYLICKKRYENIYFRKYYLSIHDLPAKRWIAMHHNEDITQLSKNGKICKRAAIVFDIIRDEIIDTFGLSPEFIEIQKAVIRLEILKSEYIEQKINKNLAKAGLTKFHIKIQEEYLKNITAPGKKTNMYEAVIWIKQQNVSIDEEHVSTFWFLTTMGFLTKKAAKSAA